MYVFDLSNLKLLSGNFHSVTVTPERTCIRCALIDFRPNGSSFDLKASLGFFLNEIKHMIN